MPKEQKYKCVSIELLWRLNCDAMSEGLLGKTIADYQKNNEGNN